MKLKQMKILHTSDWHLGNYVGPQCDGPMERMANTMKCLNVLVETAMAEQPDIILVAGDIFHQARVWSDRALTEVRMAGLYIIRLATFAPVVVLYGTPNHDGKAQFDALEGMTKGSDVHYIDEPRKLLLDTKSGFIQIAGLPGFDKGHFRTEYPGLSAEQENVLFSEQLAMIVEGLSAQVDPSIPSVLMAHHTVVGCELDNGQHVFQTNEVVLEASALDNSAFDLVCLGHIHKAQRVDFCKDKPVFYSGSIDAFTFNDEDWQKGFWIHELYSKKDDNWKSSKFYNTPAREFITERWNQEECQRAASMNFSIMGFEDKVVRVLYTCDSETEKALDKKRLERDLYAAGAYYVSEIRPEKVTASVNRERMHESLTVWDCLQKYLYEKGIKEMDDYLHIAEDFISQVQASQPAGGQTGTFLPVEISVRNYRSYAEETLSFQDIHFAMVNGVNGSGKSSLFMDALVDCLYEQPREGELTGWIRSGEKSGTISFTFQLGESVYRVVRTRQRSGKATLAIAKLDDYFNDDLADWQDISCERMTDTQQKITDLLGMDADTFRSCVLIMQDQYGRFMEAKPEDRMSVLASLLGLGMYEQLEGLAKDALRETNRELKNLKDDASVLEAEVSAAEDFREMEKEAQRLIEDKRCHAQGLKDELEACRTKLAAVENAELELLQVNGDIRKKSETRNEKRNKLSDLERDIKSTESFLENEQALIDAHTEHQKLQGDLIAFREQEKQAEDKRRQLAGVRNEIAALDAEDRKLRSEVAGLQAKLEKLPGMLDELNDLNGIEHQLEEMERKKVRHEELTRERQEQMYVVRSAEEKVARLKRQAEMLSVVQCVDIKNAQCAFLREAKEAAGKLDEAENHFAGRRELLNIVDKTIADLGYNPEAYLKVTQRVRRYNELRQAVQSCESDKRMVEVKSERLGMISLAIEEKKAIRERLNGELLSLEINLRNINAIKNKLSGLAGQENQYTQLPAAKSFLENARKQEQDLQKDIDDISAEIDVLQGKSLKLMDGLRDAEAVRRSKELAEYELSGIEGELAGLTKQLGSIEEKLRTLDGKQDKLKETVKAVNDTAFRAAMLTTLSEAFGQDGIPHQIIRDIVPELEASANEILGQMTGGRMRLEFRTERTLKSNKAKEVATLDIVIVDVDNGELPYLARSGGQKTRCSLAVIFALAILKASRVGLQLGMLFIDEPAGLDEEGIEGYCKALETIHDMYQDMRIVAVSHDERMKARFAQQIRVDVTENGSKVRKI
ncbi:MAG: exonuclease subunit SbcD [Dehalococcoidia bacterium]|nr:exonuclease subunit SbcD [Dehalococcoidia bacterium]